jgi:hypothetical protein
MVVLIKHYGFLATALVFWFPLLYVIHIIKCYFKDDRDIWHDAHDFCLDAHFSKLNWSIWVLLVLSLNNIPEGSVLNTVVGAIYIICFIISLTPVHRYFVR